MMAGSAAPTPTTLYGKERQCRRVHQCEHFEVETQEANYRSGSRDLQAEARQIFLQPHPLKVGMCPSVPTLDLLY